jgi:hypothetical protein
MSELRQAKSQAIVSNSTQCVTFDNVNKQYGISNLVSNLCSTPTSWTKLDQNIASKVTISPTNNIQFNYSGLASSGTGTVFILDLTGKQRFYVQVDQTGHTFIKGPL